MEEVYRNLTTDASPLYLSPLHLNLVAKDLLTQWNDAVWGAERPLLVLPPSVDTDIFASACALGHALRNAGKAVTILCPRSMSAHAQFLIGTLDVKTTLDETKTYTCVLPKEIKISEVRSELLREGGGTVTLCLAPDTSPAAPPSLSFSPTLPSFDRIVSLGAHDLAEISPLFGEAYDLLSQTPMVTFSWHPSCEHFGRWNVVYEQASTLSEVVAAFLQESSPEILRDHIATCALAGIIAKTKHFRTDLVTPYMLHVSANLVASGAERMKIIEELFRTRSLETLRLWGSACARLEEVLPGVLFSELNAEDFARTRTSPEILQDVAQEVLHSSEKTLSVLFFYVTEGVLHAQVAAKRPHDARAFMGALRTEGTKDVALHVFGKDTSLRETLEHLKASGM